MSILTRFILLLTLCLNLNVIAQPSKIINNRDSYNIMFGASWALLDDDGNGKNPFAFDQFHTMFFPTRAFFDKHLYMGWSVEGAGAFTKYNPEKLVNDSIGISGSLFSLDANMKYSFYQFVGRGWLDPYISAGIGVTSRTSDPRNTAKPFTPTLNVGVGVNLWVSNSFGLQLQSSAKFGMLDFKTSNYMQHTAGFVVRIEKPDGSKSDFNRSKYSVRGKHKKIKIRGGKKTKES